MKAGEEAGVSGTPAFFINGRVLGGAQPFEAFKRIIDEELRREVGRHQRPGRPTTNDATTASAVATRQRTASEV